MKASKRVTEVAALAAVAFFLSIAVNGSDWPNYLGPNGYNISTERIHLPGAVVCMKKVVNGQSVPVV